MARYLRKTIITALGEGASYGVDANPTGSNAMLVSNCTIQPWAAQNVPRDLVLGYFGGFQHLPGTGHLEVSFDVELAGAGAAATAAPAWGPLMQACGFAAAAATAGYEFTPASSLGSNSSASIYYYLDGALHKLLGARGTVSLSMMVGERPVLRFRFLGKDGGVSVTANATPTYTGFATPLAVTDTNTGDITFGCTYTGATSLLSGGTGYPSRGLSIDIGNALGYHALLGSETVDITDREVTGTLSLDLTATQAASRLSTVKACTAESIGITHGTATGHTVVIHGPAVQVLEPSIEPWNGKALHAYKLRFLPSTGNDEIRIVTR